MTSKKNGGLEELLEKARQASRETRIDHRDAIAAHGSDAISAVADWIGEPALAAFAVRVIGKAGLLGHPAEAAAALRTALPKASAVIQGDIADALAALGLKPTPPASSAKAAEPVAVNESLRDRLVAAARSGRTITYTEAGEVVGLTMRNPHHRRLLGQYLGAISEFETEHDRPMLSAVVVQKGEKRTGTGFAQLGEELGIKGALDDARTFDVRELDRVFAYWRAVAGSADPS